MVVKIVVLGDTHVRFAKEIPREILDEILKSDWLIHVGDFISLEFLNYLIGLKGDHFKGVYGNADPQGIVNLLQSKEIFEILGKRIGITHPASGGPYETVENRVKMAFRKNDVDIMIYGHTHEPKINYMGNSLLISPGKGYLETHYFGPPTTIAIILIDNKIKVKIKEITC